jgi:endonuclease I
MAKIRQKRLKIKGTGTYSDPYYSTTQDLKEEELKVALKAIITNGHAGLGYNGARDKMFMEIDNQKTNGQSAPVNRLECVYTGRVITGYADRAEAQNSTNNFNTEHTWPQSLFSQNEPMRGDLNHLFPTDEVANGIRSNFPFGKVSSPTWTVGGSKYANNVFEPRDSHKGAVARALMYFVLRYEDYGNFFAPQETNLRAWHDRFAPTPTQQKRNNDIKTAQGNKNPFIDHPEFAERITLLAGNSVAPVKTAIGYSTSSMELSAYFGDMLASNDYSIDLLNTGNATLNYSASFTQNRLFLQAGQEAGVILPDSSFSLNSFLSTTGDAIVYDTLLITTNAPGASVIRIPVKVNVTLFSGIGETAYGNFAFQLFPNPSNNELNILSKTTDEYEVYITTLQGQQAIYTKGNGTLKLNTGNLPDGVYIVSVKNKQASSQKKLVIQH